MNKFSKNNVLKNIININSRNIFIFTLVIFSFVFLMPANKVNALSPAYDELYPIGNYPLVDSVYLRGGYQQVATNSDMLAITCDRRKAAMLVYVGATDKTYRLFGGSNLGCTDIATNTKDSVTNRIYDPISAPNGVWEEIILGGGGAQAAGPDGAVQFATPNVSGGFDLAGVASFLWNVLGNNILQIGGDPLNPGGELVVEDDVLWGGALDTGGETFEPTGANQPLASRGMIGYSSSLGKFRVSEDGGDYVDLLGEGSKWEYYGPGDKNIYQKDYGDVKLARDPDVTGVVTGPSLIFEAPSSAFVSPQIIDTGGDCAAGKSASGCLSDYNTANGTSYSFPSLDNHLSSYGCFPSDVGQTYFDIVSTTCEDKSGLSAYSADINDWGTSNTSATSCGSISLANLNSTNVGVGTNTSGTPDYNYVLIKKTYEVVSCVALGTTSYSVRNSDGDLEFRVPGIKRATLTQAGDLAIRDNALPTDITSLGAPGLSGTAKLDVAGPTLLNQLAVSAEASIGKLLHFFGFGSGDPNYPPVLSPSDSGIIYFDKGSATLGDGKFKVSEDGRPYVDLIRAGGWSLDGDDLTGTPSSPNEFIGTKNDFDFVVKTNDLERIRVKGKGGPGSLVGDPVGVGIGTNNPRTQLEVKRSFSVGDDLNDPGINVFLNNYGQGQAGSVPPLIVNGPYSADYLLSAPVAAFGF